MGLDYLSPAGYRYIRRVFNNNLPAPETMRRWYRSIDTEPGITDVALQILKQKAEDYKRNGRELLLALLCDEVSIKKCVEHDEYKSQFTGFVSCENKSERSKKRKNKKNANELDVAKDALVFMCVGENFKVPVAYFFLCGLEAVERAALTQEVIRQVNGTGAKIWSLTADGTITNISCVKHLGVNFEKNEPFFKSPTTPSYNIYFLLDAPHMLKLARGCIANHQLYYEQKPISWSYVKDLYDLQKSRNFNLGNKLTSLHIDWHLKPMNVALAAEVMSKSVSYCIDQLREDNYEEFQNSYETSEFLVHVNNVFDICNVKSNRPPSDNQYKQPISENNSQELFQYFQKAKEYFLSIEIDEANSKTKEMKRKLAIRSRSLTPFLGMVHNLTSLQSLYNDYVVNGELTEIYSFQCCQDHLETWFSCMRRGLGSNDNPTAAEFTRLYRKLLVCHEITYDGNKANCISNETGILTVSSEIMSQSLNKKAVHEVHEMEELNYYDVINEDLEPFDLHLNAYAASMVEEKIKQRTDRLKNKCVSCSQAFQENEKTVDSFIARKKSNQPCKSTVNIVTATNKIMFLLPNKEFSIYSISMMTLNSLDFNDLYEYTNFEEHTNDDELETWENYRDHKTHFLSNVIETYINMKAHKIGNKIRDEERGRYIRHKNTKLIHTSGQ